MNYQHHKVHKYFHILEYSLKTATRSRTKLSDAALLVGIDLAGGLQSKDDDMKNTSWQSNETVFAVFHRKQMQ